VDALWHGRESERLAGARTAARSSIHHDRGRSRDGGMGRRTGTEEDARDVRFGLTHGHIAAMETFVDHNLAASIPENFSSGRAGLSQQQFLYVLSAPRVDNRRPHVAQRGAGGQRRKLGLRAQLAMVDTNVSAMACSWRRKTQAGCTIEQRHGECTRRGLFRLLWSGLRGEPGGARIRPNERKAKIKDVLARNGNWARRRMALPNTEDKLPVCRQKSTVVGKSWCPGRWCERWVRWRATTVLTWS
jgi:hypothetical protein